MARTALCHTCLPACRRDDAVVINVTMDREAAELLAEYCPSTQRNKGNFVARLLYEHHARRQERNRLRQELEEEKT